MEKTFTGSCNTAGPNVLAARGLISWGLNTLRLIGREPYTTCILISRAKAPSFVSFIRPPAFEPKIPCVMLPRTKQATSCRFFLAQDDDRIFLRFPFSLACFRLRLLGP